MIGTSVMKEVKEEIMTNAGKSHQNKLLQNE